jgi:hypothetical protein
VTASKSRPTDERAQFRESLERNRRKLEAWPEWMRHGSVGERAVRETTPSNEERVREVETK